MSRFRETMRGVGGGTGRALADPEFTLVEMPLMGGGGEEGDDEKSPFGALRRGLRRKRD